MKINKKQYKIFLFLILNISNFYNQISAMKYLKHPAIITIATGLGLKTVEKKYSFKKRNQLKKYLADPELQDVAQNLSKIHYNKEKTFLGHLNYLYKYYIRGDNTVYVVKKNMDKIITTREIDENSTTPEAMASYGNFIYQNGIFKHKQRAIFLLPNQTNKNEAIAIITHEGNHNYYRNNKNPHERISIKNGQFFLGENPISRKHDEFFTEYRTVLDLAKMNNYESIEEHFKKILKRSDIIEYKKGVIEGVNKLIKDSPNNPKLNNLKKIMNSKFVLDILKSDSELDDKPKKVIINLGNGYTMPTFIHLPSFRHLRKPFKKADLL